VHKKRRSGTRSVKVSITLPADLAAWVHAEAGRTGQSVSATISSAIRQAFDGAKQDRLDAALEVDRDANRAFARLYAPAAAEWVSTLEW
jgi:hypothetical protein